MIQGVKKITLFQKTLPLRNPSVEKLYIPAFEFTLQTSNRLQCGQFVYSSVLENYFWNFFERY